MTDDNKAAKKSASSGKEGDLGADQVQQAFDEANEKGYFGWTPDETPNENYSLETPQDAPTPETTERNEQAESRKRASQRP